MEFEALAKIINELAPNFMERQSPSFPPLEPKWQVHKIGVTVDPTPENLRQAEQCGINLLFTYHPWTGEPSKAVASGRLRILALHHAWNLAPQGIIPELANALALTDLNERQQLVFGTTDTLLRNLIETCQRSLEITVVPYSGELRAPVKQVAIWLGAGFLPHHRELWETCIANGCDTLLSGELTLAALRFGVNHNLKMVDLGHSAVARMGMKRFAQILSDRLQADCPVERLDGYYACNYFTNYSITDMYSAALNEDFPGGDSEETLSLFSLFDKME